MFFSFVDEITRDFVPNVGDPETRKAKLIPWVPADMTDVDYFQKEPDVSFFQVYCCEREIETERETERDMVFCQTSSMSYAGLQQQKIDNVK